MTSSVRAARLALADGTVIHGRSFGAPGPVVGEVVFNTSMTGYQEILTDPSYVGQLVTMTVAELGNVGTNPTDDEAPRPSARALLCRRFSPPSNYRSTEALDAYLVRHGIFGFAEFDTRKLVRHLRTHGAQNGVLSEETVPDARLVERARAAPSMEGLDLATSVSTPKAYAWDSPYRDVFGAGAPKPQGAQRHVVAIDYGLKRAMIELLVAEGLKVTIVPSRVSAAEVLALKPDGVFLTNGPGDPAAVVGAKECVQGLLGKVPIFGICLGHQILALALGAKTYKLKFGHRGANHPVLEKATGRVAITSQNHGFAVDARTLEGKADVTHTSLNDNTVEGLDAARLNAFSVQYHPEASPGPHDARPLFQKFVHRMGSPSAR